MSETSVCHRWVWTLRTLFVSKRRVNKVEISDSHSRGCESEKKTPRTPTSEHPQFYVMLIPRTPLFPPFKKQACLENTLIIEGQDSHLRGPSPPALVSHAEAAQALSLGHLVLPRALVLPPGHGGASFVLQLRQMLHAAVHLQGDTVGSIIIWSVSYWPLWVSAAGVIAVLLFEFIFAVCVSDVWGWFCTSLVMIILSSVKMFWWIGLEFRAWVSHGVN